MNITCYTFLSIIAFSSLFASVGFADQTGQNAPGTNLAAPVSNAGSKSASDAPPTSKPTSAAATSGNAGNVGTHHHSGSGILGGAAKNTVSINGTTIRPTHHLSQ